MTAVHNNKRDRMQTRGQTESSWLYQGTSKWILFFRTALRNITQEERRTQTHKQRSPLFTQKRSFLSKQLTTGQHRLGQTGPRWKGKYINMFLRSGNITSGMKCIIETQQSERGGKRGKGTFPRPSPAASINRQIDRQCEYTFLYFYMYSLQTSWDASSESSSTLKTDIEWKYVWANRLLYL